MRHETQDRGQLVVGVELGIAVVESSFGTDVFGSWREMVEMNRAHIRRDGRVCRGDGATGAVGSVVAFSQCFSGAEGGVGVEVAGGVGVQRLGCGQTVRPGSCLLACSCPQVSCCPAWRPGRARGVGALCHRGESS
jgi:hypothetical protein